MTRPRAAAAGAARSHRAPAKRSGRDAGRGERCYGSRVPRPSRPKRDPRRNRGFRSEPSYGRDKPVRPGDELSLEVEGLADGPDAMCRVGDYVVFVAGALPGERVLVRVTNAGRKFGRAELLRVERPSPDRVGPRCRHFLECGGCHFQHLAYPKQLEHKTARLEKTLAHALRRDALPIVEMAAPEDPWGQRNKIALQVIGRANEAQGGFFRMRSRDVVPVRECPVQDPRGTALSFAAVDAIGRTGIEPWREWDDRGVVKAVVVRAMKGTGDAHVTVVSRTPRIPREEKLVRELLRTGATGVSVNLNDRPGPQLLGRHTDLLAGPKRIAEELGGVRYLSSPGAFFQTSAWGARHLVDAVRRLVDAPEGARVIDLYSGGGLLSLALASRGAQVLGIEENPSATGDAIASARANGLERAAEFATGPVEAYLRDLARERAPFAVVLDPPREGCDPRVVEAVSRLAPEKIVYVSCEPSSLGRDLALFDRLGWDTTRVEPLDMFPHAFHLESIAVLERPRRPVRRYPRGR